MSQFYDQASLVVVPSGYKAGKVYAQKPLSTDGELTFTRSTGATRVGPDGLIEKVRTNQALYSSDFTNAYWIKTNATITGNTIANPIDGALTADTFTPTNTSSTNRIRSASISLASAGMSIYVKANGYTKVGIREDITSGYYASYDLSSGTILDSSGVVSPTITALANGWYRISLGATASPVGMGVWILDPTYTTGAFNTSNWTTNGTSGIYVFGAQLELSDFGATPYIGPTTTAAVSVGPVANLPRLDYLGSTCGKLLLEGQRTNLVTNSENLSGAGWSGQGSTITSNATTSPDGYSNADAIVETATTDEHNRIFNTTLTAASHTASVFLKKFNQTWCALYLFNGTVGIRHWINLDTLTAGTSANIGAGIAAPLTLTNYGNGWVRASMTWTADAAAWSFYIGCARSNGGATTYAGDGTSGIFAWGAQIEGSNSAYATSYIPTLGAAVTRGADAASKTGISSLIGQTEGTLFLDVTLDQRASSTYFVIAPNLGSASAYIGISMEAARLNAEIANSGIQANISFTNSSTGRFKAALAYKANDVAFYVNGTLVGTDTSATIPACSQFALNNYGQEAGPKYNQALLFPTHLSNADLATLTTL